MSELPQLRSEWPAKMFAMRRVQHAIAQPVIGPCERDDSPTSRCQNRRFQRRFHRFKTRVAENHLARLLLCPAFKCQSAQFPRELRLERVRMHIAHRVQQRAHLPLPRFYDLGVRMPRRCYAERRRQVEVLLARAVPNVHPARPFPYDGPRAVRLHERHVR